MDIFSLLVEYQYLFLFAGLLFAGEIVLLPAIYLSLEGQMDPFIVILLTLIAGIISDLVWYYLAANAPVEKIKTWHRVARHEREFAKLSALFEKHQYRILFISKFVYGTRILVQIICGLQHMDMRGYLVANAVGALGYVLLLFLIAIVTDRVLAPDDVRDLQVSFIVFVGIVILINLWIRYLVRKRWFQS